MDLYYLFVNIRCVCSLVQNRINLGASFGQVLDKFRTSFGQFWISFVLKLVLEREWIVSFLSTDILVYVSLVKKWTNLGASSRQVPDKFQTSSRQVPDKFRTSFIFKLVRELSENQTCLRVVRVYIGICGFCTWHVQVVQKPKLSTSC